MFGISKQRIFAENNSQEEKMKKVLFVLVLILLLSVGSVYAEVKVMVAPMLLNVGEESKIVSIKDYNSNANNESELLKNAKTLNEMSKEGWKIIYADPIKFRTGDKQYIIILEK